MTRGRILIVDDEDMVLKTMLAVLESWAAAQAVDLASASSGAQALKILESDHQSVCVVLSDLRMPGMSGSDLLEEIRQRYPHIVTMLATGFLEIREISRAVSAGIFSFILKPWDLDYLEGQLSKALEFHSLQEDNRRYVGMLEDELRWGGALQREILKIAAPQDPKVSFGASYVPLEEIHCGGDFYDLIVLGERRYLCLIGDVAGHGIKAAFITVALKAMTRELFDRERLLAPAEVLRWLNRRVRELLPEVPDLLVTFGAYLVQADSYELAYANAGHPPAYIVRAGAAHRLYLPGPGLGFTTDPHYEERLFALQPGDRLALYTDGLIELERGVGSVDESRFCRELVAAAETGDFAGGLIARMRLLAPGNRFIDDVAVLSALLG